MATDTHRRLLTVAEVAERLAVSASTVRRLIREGEIAGFQLGGPGRSVRVDEQQLEWWLRGEPGVDPEGELKLKILGAHDRGDTVELERLQEEFRRTYSVVRPGGPPEFRRDE